MSKVVMIIAFRDFRDEEYFWPKEILEIVTANGPAAAQKFGQSIIKALK